MSVSIGFLGEGFSIVAADTRATHLNPALFNNEKCADDCEKIFLAEFGWVALAGGVKLVSTFFNKYLTTHFIKTRRDVYNGFLVAVKETETLAKKLFPDAVKELSNIQFIYSLNYFKDGLSMGLETLDFAYGRRKLTAKNSLVVNPPKQTKRIKRLIEKYSNLAKGAQDVHEAVYFIACFMDELSRISKWVNNTVDCGISYRVSDTELLFMQIRENAKTIQKLYNQQKDLSSIMIVQKEEKYGKV